MLFNSFQFLFFFATVTSLYFMLPHKYRWILLLIASCYFYMAFVPIYILILAFTIIIDYSAGIYIEKSPVEKRKYYLIISLIANIGILAFFKYYNFLNGILSHLLNSVNFVDKLPYLQIALPIGLSFHTFQAMSYTIEVYKGKQKAERNFGIYSLYVMFYPQLVAGPIERPQNLIHQFKEEHSFDYNKVLSGLRLMLWGFFKKIVIADRLGIVTDIVYSHPYTYNSISLIIATLFFSFQIFCDFSGYSDIAIGAARIMGFNLITNFNSPYRSQSISEFWNRWHISLSTWFKDYLYIPLGGNRVSIARWCFNISIVFLVSGLWHGANWTFIAWGAIHGFYLIVASITKKQREHLALNLRIGKLPKVLSMFFTFGLVAYAWIFFKASTIRTALYVAKHILTDIPALLMDILHNKPVFQYLGVSKLQLFISFLLIIFLEIVHYLLEKKNLIRSLLISSRFFRWTVYYIMIIIIITLGVFDHRQFIYFQF